MSFDSIPEDLENKQPCPKCEHGISQNERLANENEMLRKAYMKMRNAAAGYSNFCEEGASTKRCDREYAEAESLFRSICA